ncbi:hypothetical protein Vafri_18717 [Volvox africanus]|uniref:Uncharacterized protein n=2 Tax=Volvox africanus TaxID=51714 RepID=A0A8J4BPS8_9CHLO|nr:hypothetical protein Vafri_18717 [Volvox africanus]
MNNESQNFSHAHGNVTVFQPNNNVIHIDATKSNMIVIEVRKAVLLMGSTTSSVVVGRSTYTSDSDLTNILTRNLKTSDVDFVCVPSDEMPDEPRVTASFHKLVSFLDGVLAGTINPYTSDHVYPPCQLTACQPFKALNCLTYTCHVLFDESRLPLWEISNPHTSGPSHGSQQQSQRHPASCKKTAMTLPAMVALFKSTPEGEMQEDIVKEASTTFSTLEVGLMKKVCDECFPVGSDGCSTLRQKDYDPSSQKGKGSACKDGNPRVLTPQDIDNAKYIKLACILATGRFVRQVLELGTQYPHILLHLYIVHRRNFKASATSTFVPYEPYASPGQVLKAVNG